MNTDTVQPEQLSLSVFHQAVLLGAVALIVIVPGLLVILAGYLVGAARRRPIPWAGLAAAPAVTFGGASILTGLFADNGVRWNGTSFVWGFLGLTVVAAVLVGLLSLLPGAQGAGPGPDRPRWAIPAGTVTALAVGAIAVLSAWSIARSVGGLDSTVPTFDALFHSTAMRWIAENGQACATCLGAVNEPANPDPYYPTAYHAVSAIGVLLTGWQLPGTYVAMIALTAPVFVVGSVAMASEFGARNVALVVAAVVAVVVPFFPSALVSYGQLAPFGMAVAALPGVIAAVAGALRRPSPGVIPVLALGILGVVALHPSVGIILLAVAALQGLGTVLGHVVDRVRRRNAREPGLLRVLWVVAGGVLAGVLTLTTVDTGTAEDLSSFSWPAVDTLGGSRDLVVFLAGSPGLVRILVLGLSAVGLLAVISWRAGLRRALPTVVIGAVAMWLAILCRGSDEQWTIDLTYLWWNDWYRLAAISVIAWVAAAAVGAQALLRLASRLPRRRIPVLLLATALAAGSVTVAVTTEPSRSGITSRGWVEDRRLVTDGELDAYEWLAERYDGGVVLNDPGDGSPWLYTLHGVPVVFNVPLGRDPEDKHGEERLLLNYYAHDAGVPGALYQREVNQAIEDLDVRWVIVGPTRVFGREQTAGGFLKLDESPAFDRAYDSDGVVIYQVDRRLIASQS